MQVAAAKGLFQGSLTLHLADGSSVSGEAAATLIPVGESVEDLDVGEGVGFVLVIEKEVRLLCL